jgi:hypothetical protein
MKIFGITRRYSLGPDFAHILAASKRKGLSTKSELDHYTLKSKCSDDEYLLVPKYRSWRPALTLQHSQGEWFITYHFLDMVLISMGFLALLIMRVATLRSISLTWTFLAALLLGSWLLGWRSVVLLDKRFREMASDGHP